MIKGVLLCLALYLAYKIGWINAHYMVSLECRKNGGFFVGKRVFKCSEVIDDKTEK